MMAQRLHSQTSQLHRSHKAEKPVMLCLSHLRWDFVFQRPQHLLTRACDSYRVLFFEEPFFDAKTPSITMQDRGNGLLIAQPHLPAETDARERHLMLRKLLDETLAMLDVEQPDLIWYYSPAMIAFAGHLKAKCIVYDCMDELAAFRGAAADLKWRERELFGRADLVFTGGQSLFEAKRRMHPAVHAFPSSIDTQHFQKARHLRQLASNPAKPNLGFFGVIDERMDTALVAAIADLRPDWHFSMIGPVVKIDVSDLPQRPNLYWLGRHDYRDLPVALAQWSLGIMPFAINEATRYISPTKTPEFLAAGLPVVSTPIRDVVRPYGEMSLVGIAATANEFVAQCENCLAWTETEHAAWLSRVDQFLARTSWDRTWSAMNNLVTQLVAQRRRLSVAPAKPSLLPMRNPGVARV